MARDLNAATIQGPDNGSGNPLLVSMAPGTTDENIKQVGGVNVPVDPSYGNPFLPIGDVAGGGFKGIPYGYTRNSILTSNVGFRLLQSSGPANTAVVISPATVPNSSTNLVLLGWQFDGANAATTLVIRSGATLIWTILIPAGAQQLTTIFLGFPGLFLNDYTVGTIFTLGTGGLGIAGWLTVGYIPQGA